MRLTLSIATEGITQQKTTQTDPPGMNQQINPVSLQPISKLHKTVVLYY